jgi:polygalacturonase
MLTSDGILPGGGKGDSGSFYAGDHFGLDALPAEPLNPPIQPPKKSTALNFQMPAKIPGTPDYDPPEPNSHDQYQDHGHSHWHNSLIWGENLENISIIGEGTIDGRGLTWNADPANPTGNKAIALKNCRNVTLKDFTMFRAGHFAVLATGCDQVMIDHLKIDTNRDGLDIDSCRDVSITNCSINSPNDDAIVLKSSYALGFARATEDVTIRDCHLSGFDMGTLIDGTRRTTQKIAPDRGGVTGRIKFGTESNGGFRHINISNCTFTHCRGLALETVDGGPMEDITVTNLTMHDITTAPLFIRLGNRARGPAGSPVSIIRGIRISNLTVSDAEPRYASLIAGIPGHLIEDVELSDIQISYRGGGGKLDAQTQPPERETAYPEPNMLGVIPAYGLFCRHIRGLRVRNVSVTFEKDDHRPPTVLEDVHDATFENLQARRLHDVPAFVLRDISDFVVIQSAGIQDHTLAASKFCQL